MNRQKFINYINNELGLELTAETPHIDELERAIYPYEDELLSGKYNILSRDNFNDYYGEKSSRLIEIVNCPHWFDLVIYHTLVQAQGNAIQVTPDELPYVGKPGGHPCGSKAEVCVSVELIEPLFPNTVCYLVGYVRPEEFVDPDVCVSTYIYSIPKQEFLDSLKK